MTPTLKDFWSRFDYEKYNPGTDTYDRIEPDSLDFEKFQTGYTRGSASNKSWLLLQNVETLDVWAIEVWSPDSWDASDCSDRFIDGPFKVKPEPREITVYDYVRI